MARCDADIAIIDLSMPPLGGVAAIRHIKARHPRTRILALSGTDDVQLAEEALCAGADGFLPKTASESSGRRGRARRFRVRSCRRG
ncbi:response regulator [Mycobacterium sp. HUMS_1102779]|uniref:response regulator n=1 Tax=Mycobacterium sp. HUMS_1102779 TaxID=3383487 RepID=UPI003899B130